MGFEIVDNVLCKYEEEQGVTDVIIPNGVISIGEGAFYSCKNLKTVVIPESVVSI